MAVSHENYRAIAGEITDNNFSYPEGGHSKNCRVSLSSKFRIKFSFLFQVDFAVRHFLLHPRVSTPSEDGTMEVTKDQGLSGVT